MIRENEREQARLERRKMIENGTYTYTSRNADDQNKVKFELVGLEKKRITMGNEKRALPTALNYDNRQELKHEIEKEIS